MRYRFALTGAAAALAVLTISGCSGSGGATVNDSTNAPPQDSTAKVAACARVETVKVELADVRFQLQHPVAMGDTRERLERVAREKALAKELTAEDKICKG